MELIDLTAGHPALRHWHRILVEASHVGRDHATPMALGELTAALAYPTRRLHESLVLGVDRGTPVVAGRLRLPMLDNLAHAGVEVHVAPEHRRAGYGSAMLERLEQRAAAADRTVLETELEYRLEVPPDGDWAGIRFAHRHGYRLVQEEVQRTLTVPVASHLLVALADEAARSHPGYLLETYVGDEQPADRARAVAALDATLVVEAPSGDRSDLEAMALDAAADEETAEQMRAQGRTRVRSAAIAPDGQVVAYSDLVVPELDPGRAFQWGTLVRRDHRGHRLGLATKVATLREVQARFPDVRRAITWNAASNLHMIAINEQIGFRATEKLATWEKRRAGGALVRVGEA